jgi:PAS domain S-box-containing protein
MGEYTPLVFLHISVGLLVAGLSWRLSRLRADGAYLRFWALYWTAATSSIAAEVLLAPNPGSPDAQDEVFQFSIVLLLSALRPALLSMAAASLFRGLSQKTLRFIGAAVLLIAAVTVLIDRSGAGGTHPARPEAAAYLMSSAAAFVFAFAYSRRQRAERVATLLSSAVILAYALHLAAFGLTGYGLPVYPPFSPPISAGSTVGIVLGCLIAFGLGLDALRQAEQARHHAETLWVAAQEGMILLSKTGNVLQANPAYGRIVDRPLEAIQGCAVSDAFAERMRIRVAATVLSALSSGQKGSPRIVHADLWNGREVWLEFSFSPLPGGNVVLSIVRDATERVLAQQRYTMMVSRTPIGIHFYAFDPARGLVFTGANEAADRILGILHQPLVGKLIEEAFPSLAGTDIPAAYRAVLSSGKPFRRDEVFYKDERIAGAFEVVCFQLTADSIAVMFNNITDRKRAEEALRASEARYRLITDNSTDMISVHSPEGVFLFASPSARTLLGYDPDQLLGRSCYEFFHPEDLDTLRANHRILEATQEPQCIAYRMRRADGSWAWVETFARVIPPDGGSPSPRLVAVTRDITERRRLEEQFRLAQRLESIGRLAGGVAHDFNNLLTVINGYAAVIEADSAAPQKTRDLASNILQAGERAASLTRHLLAFSRRQRLEPVALNLNQIILDAERLLLHLIGGNIKLVLNLDAAPGEILADPIQIHQVLQNLAVNARDAISGSGTITIATSRQSVRAGDPAAREMPPGHYCALSVLDTGCGMPSDVQEKIFEPFFTTKAPGQGTGLGLSTVFGIVQQSNGYLLVNSEPGQGSEFRLYFPLIEGGRPPADGQGEARAAARSDKSILLVEDQPEVADYISSVLENHGYSVITASCGDHALSLLAHLPRPPRLVLSDVIMPGMDGRKLAALIRERHPGTAIVLMSGNERQTPAGGHGQVSFLAKPFTEESLLRALRAGLD